MLSFSDIQKTEQINEDGLKIPMADILGQEIVVLGYEMRTSHMHKPDYLMLKIEYNGEKRVIFTNSEILQKQCKQYEDQMPFTATIKQKGQYYTFT